MWSRAQTGRLNSQKGVCVGMGWRELARAEEVDRLRKVGVDMCVDGACARVCVREG